MNKLIIIILLLATVQVFSQDTCKQYVIRGMDFSKIDTIIVPCSQIKSMQGKPAMIQDTISIKAQYDTISVAIQKLNTALENSYSQEQKEIVKMITKYIGMQELLLFQYNEERKKK